MKRIQPWRLNFRLFVAVGLALALMAPALTAAAESSRKPVAGRETTARYIVALADGVSAEEVSTVYVVGRGGAVTQRYATALNGFAAEMTEAAAEELRADPRVMSVMLDPVITAYAQTTPTGVKRIFTLDSTQANIDGVDNRVNVDVAVLDTGSGPHADLNIAGGKDCTGGTNYNDGNGHGTHVAGTIGALDNGDGVVGVAPGARIWSVKVLGSNGSGYGSWLICGIDWVTANSSVIEVANMSLGGPGYTDDNNCGYSNGDTIHQAICRSVNAGVTWTVAAGNDGKDAKDYFPAQYDEVITVSALNDSDGLPGGDTLASFSNFGADVDVIAPGVAILSTVHGGGYQSWNGTSMASPHAAGAAALYKAINPSATPAQVAAALKSTGDTTSWSGDKDAFKEPLLNVSTFDGNNFSNGGGGGGGSTIDAQVVSVSAPASVTRGQSATVTAQIKNNGTASATISVKFQEAPGGANQTKSQTVAAGSTVNVSFSWATTSTTALGTHTFTITTTLSGDSNSSNNTGTATTNVVAGSTSTTDAQVVSVSAPSSVTRGQSATVTAQIKNNSSSSKTISVRFQEAPGGASQTKSISLAANAQGSVSFSWATTSTTALGTHTFTITTTLSGDSNSSNNTGTATTNVVAGSTGGGGTMSVTAMTLTKTNVTGGYRLTGRVTVKSGTTSVSGASVRVDLTMPNGSKVTLTATTNSSGIATFTRSVTAKGKYTLTVTSVSKSGMTYSSAGNTVSTVSLTIT
ncbi:MAG: hypothetical protein DCC58_19050 [Chloroflexi bacterium]|nr:MAG: hypothetical protein DCC58_19050 [Chloroflexota bacterium]